GGPGKNVGFDRRSRSASRDEAAVLTNAMKSPTALEELIEALRCLPGVGPKSAQRIAYHLLQYDKTGAARLAQSLQGALQSIRRCAKCNSFTELELCVLCGSPRRDQIGRASCRERVGRAG